MSLRPVHEHRAWLLQLVSPLPPVTVASSDALGLVLAEDVVAAVDLPGFDNSAMDGYSVTAAAVEAATAQAPVTLPVLGDIPAGDTRQLSQGDTECWRIMTGAPLPQGADAVIPVEWTDGGTSEVNINAGTFPGQHVRRQGEDVHAGDVVVPAGTQLGPGHLAVTIAANVATVRAHPRPSVMIISTGNELLPAGSTPQSGQLIDSNGPTLAALAQAAGADVAYVGHVPDDPNVIHAMVEAHPVRPDLVLTTGGVSAGAYDTVKAVLSERGVEFVKVAMRPGMPQGGGRLQPQDVPIVTLPGNPVSALVSFHIFVLPLVHALAGTAVNPDPLAQAFPAVAGAPWATAHDKLECTRVFTYAGPDGLMARPSGMQGSHMLSAVASATALALIPVGVERVQPGDVVQCLPLLGQDRPRV